MQYIIWGLFFGLIAYGYDFFWMLLLIIVASILWPVLKILFLSIIVFFCRTYCKITGNKEGLDKIDNPWKYDEFYKKYKEKEESEKKQRRT